MNEREIWFRRVPPEFRSWPAFEFVEDVPGRPRVLLIGDSISIGYTPFVRDRLRERAIVHRIPDNGRSTWEGLANLDDWLSSGPWDVIHFNWGLHDLKFVDSTEQRRRPRTTPEEYARNLETLVRRLRRTGAALIWATTTPVPGGTGLRRAGGEIEFNRIAERIMETSGVRIDDLHGAVRARCDTLQIPRDVHFTEPGYGFLGECAARSVADAAGLRL